MTAPRTWRTLAMGRRGAVASNHPLATQAGLDTLKGGGNAFDAAVAVAATIAVVEPQSNGVGGDAFFLLWQADQQRAVVVQGACPASRRATLELYRDGIPHVGPAAAMPPGAVAAWHHLASRYGTLAPSELVRAAVHYAREGFPASRAFCRDVQACHEKLLADEGCRTVYLPEGSLPRVGTIVRNPALARTLETLAFSGADALYGGELGGHLAQFCDASSGPLGLDDLAGFVASEVPPLSLLYRGLTVLNAPPPSMGFCLLQELGVAEHFDLQAMEYGSADLVHTLVEIKKLCFREREAYAGDPATVRAPLDVLLGEDLCRELARRVDPRRAGAELGPPALPGDTTYFAVVDGWGNAVSGIQSLALPFGAACLEPKTGILLNSRMVWFHTEPEHPNVVAPGKHVRNTINPPMAIKDGSVRCVWGTPGGDAQVQVTLQNLVAVKDFGLDPQAALEAPRWVHHQPGTGSYYPHVEPDELVIESSFGQDALGDLSRRGHRLRIVGPLEGPCAASMIVRGPSGLLQAGADPRRDGSALAH